MLARLGQVLYWAACGIAMLCLVALLYVLSSVPPDDRFADTVMIGGFAVVTWLVGRAFRYVLAGN